ncbi:MAG: hypothetical protein ACI35T_03475 [Alistipes sp.]
MRQTLVGLPHLFYVGTRVAIIIPTGRELSKKIVILLYMADQFAIFAL